MWGQVVKEDDVRPAEGLKGMAGHEPGVTWSCSYEVDSSDLLGRRFAIHKKYCVQAPATPRGFHRLSPASNLIGLLGTDDDHRGGNTFYSRGK
ncbi:hypothetical protein GCM10023352_09070 [Rothia endophytica]|uniref:Uncharacterized protein n=1 Tax=Rothia endophytica TaxID=1324766 RepID=A0ABP9BDL8_9MICC